VFVTGGSAGKGTMMDFATIAYDAATGAQLWVGRFNDHANGIDAGQALAVSPDGKTVYVTGSGQVSGPKPDYVTIAYDAATGERKWIRDYNGPGNGWDVPSSLTVGPRGAVYVTGSSRGRAAALQDYATIAYSATGARLWLKRFNGPASGTDDANSVTVSPGGHLVVITGDSSAGATAIRTSYATIAYKASTGRRLWVSRYAGPRHGYNVACSAAITPDGRTVFVTGTSQGTADSRYDYATIDYNAGNGRRIWVRRYNGPTNSRDFASFVAVGPHGHTAYVTGTSGSDYGTVAYAVASGARRWVGRFPGIGPGFGCNHVLAVGPVGTVYVTGQSGIQYGTIAYRG
jgi:hypothetical protein